MPKLYDLSFETSPSDVYLFLNFERFRRGKRRYAPGNVKLFESPGRAEGLPIIISSFAVASEGKKVTKSVE